MAEVIIIAKATIRHTVSKIQLVSHEQALPNENSILKLFS